MYEYGIPFGFLFPLAVSKVFNTFGPQTQLLNVSSQLASATEVKPEPDLHIGIEERMKNIADHLHMKFGMDKYVLQLISNYKHLTSNLSFTFIFDYDLPKLNDLFVVETKRDLAEQIRSLEERILYLESLSPEYFSKSVSYYFNDAVYWQNY